MDAGSLSDPDHPVLRYFVMEFVPGQDLEEQVNTNGPLSPAKACDVIHQIAAALAEVQAQPGPSRHQALQHSTQPRWPGETSGFWPRSAFQLPDDRTGTVLGTLDFMAPEQTSDAGSVDILADVWPGRHLVLVPHRTHPLAKENLIEQLTDRQTKPPPSVCSLRPEIPAALDAVVSRMMSIQPNDRYATPQLVMRALLPFLKPEMRDAWLPRDAAVSPRRARVGIAITRSCSWMTNRKFAASAGICWTRRMDLIVTKQPTVFSPWRESGQAVRSGVDGHRHAGTDWPGSLSLAPRAASLPSPQDHYDVGTGDVG